MRSLCLTGDTWGRKSTVNVSVDYFFHIEWMVSMNIDEFELDCNPQFNMKHWLKRTLFCNSKQEYPVRGINAIEWLRQRDTNKKWEYFSTVALMKINSMMRINNMSCVFGLDWRPKLNTNH